MAESDRRIGSATAETGSVTVRASESSSVRDAGRAEPGIGPVSNDEASREGEKLGSGTRPSKRRVIALSIKVWSPVSIVRPDGLIPEFAEKAASEPFNRA
jgi:hypothetical protein